MEEFWCNMPVVEILTEDSKSHRFIPTRNEQIFVTLNGHFWIGSRQHFKAGEKAAFVDLTGLLMMSDGCEIRANGIRVSENGQFESTTISWHGLNKNSHLKAIGIVQKG